MFPARGNGRVAFIYLSFFLQGEMVEVMGLRIFGLPDTLPVPGSNHLAFVVDTEEEMKRRAGAIPSSGVHILVSLCP